MLRTIISLFMFLFSLSGFAAACDPAISLNVTRPYDHEAEPTVVAAKAISGCPITTIRVYVDTKLIYEQHAQSTLDGRLVMGPGPHAVTIQAWNSAGALAKKQRLVVSDSDPVEPLAGCEIGGISGVAYTGDSIPFTTQSPARMGMVGHTEGARITSMRLYIDGVDRAQTTGTSGYCLPAAMISLKPGYHFINLQGWDAAGNIYLSGSIMQVVP